MQGGQPKSLAQAIAFLPPTFPTPYSDFPSSIYKLIYCIHPYNYISLISYILFYLFIYYFSNLFKNFFLHFFYILLFFNLLLLLAYIDFGH